MNFSCCSRLENSLMKMIKWCIGGLHLCCMSRQGEVFWFGRRSAELRLHPQFLSTFILSGVTWFVAGRTLSWQPASLVCRDGCMRDSLQLLQF